MDLFLKKKTYSYLPVQNIHCVACNQKCNHAYNIFLLVRILMEMN